MVDKGPDLDSVSLVRRGKQRSDGKGGRGVDSGEKWEFWRPGVIGEALLVNRPDSHPVPIPRALANLVQLVAAGRHYYREWIQTWYRHVSNPAGWYSTRVTGLSGNGREMGEDGLTRFASGTHGSFRKLLRLTRMQL